MICVYAQRSRFTHDKNEVAMHSCHIALFVEFDWSFTRLLTFRHTYSNDILYDLTWNARIHLVQFTKSLCIWNIITPDNGFSNRKKIRLFSSVSRCWRQCSVYKLWELRLSLTPSTFRLKKQSKKENGSISIQHDIFLRIFFYVVECGPIFAKNSPNIGIETRRREEIWMPKVCAVRCVYCIRINVVVGSASQSLNCCIHPNVEISFVWLHDESISCHKSINPIFMVYKCRL